MQPQQGMEEIVNVCISNYCSLNVPYQQLQNLNRHEVELLYTMMISQKIIEQKASQEMRGGHWKSLNHNSYFDGRYIYTSE